MCSQHQKRRNVWSGGWEGLSDATFPPPHRWVVTSLCWEMWFFLMFPKPPWSRGLNPCKASRQNPPEVVSRRQGFAVDLVQRWKKPLLPCFKLPSLGLSGPYLLMIVLLLANTSTNCISKYWLQHGFCCKHTCTPGYQTLQDRRDAARRVTPKGLELTPLDKDIKEGSDTVFRGMTPISQPAESGNKQGTHLLCSKWLCRP